MNNRKDNQHRDSSWAFIDERTISATTDSENGDMKTTSWPRKATSKDELNDDQIEVIKKAVTHPSIDNIAELNRRCEYETYHADTYAHQVLEQHWPERLESHFNEEGIDMVAETESNEDTEIGGISMSSDEDDNDETPTETKAADSEEIEWPNEVTEKEKLNHSQAKVIEAAVANPGVESTGELTEMAGVADSHNRYYAYDVLESHWPQMLDTILENDEHENDEQETTDVGTTKDVNAEDKTDGSDKSNTDESENKEVVETISQSSSSETVTGSDSDTDDQTETTPHQIPSEPTTSNSQSNDSNSMKMIGAFIAGFIIAYRLLRNNTEE